MRRRTILIIIFPIIVLIGILLFLSIKRNIEDKKFYRNGSNAKIIDRSAWQARIIQYNLEDGLQINMPRGGMNINVGDSIVKEAYSWEFDVYKKSHAGQYKFYRRYNFAEYF